MDFQGLIPPEDWEKTPQSVQMLVRSLLEQVQALQVEVKTLREHLGQTSRNSSRPPSSDPPEMPKRERVPSGRRPGGQPGHKGISRSFTASERGHPR